MHVIHKMDDDDECPICYKELSKSFKCRYDCQHQVCIECLIELRIVMPNKCPLCMTNTRYMSYLSYETIRVTHLDKNYKGPVLNLCVNLRHTLISTIKEMIMMFDYGDATKASEIRLRSDRSNLGSDRTCAHYHIKDDDVIFMSIKR